MSIYDGGFRLTGGDSKGKCITKLASSDMLSEMGDPILKFNVDLSYGCVIPLTYDELKSECNSNWLSNLEIFTNLDNIDYFGDFGSANIYYPKVSFQFSLLN